MDKALLLAAALIALTFVLAFAFTFIRIPNNLNTFVSIIVVASFPIGALIILARIMHRAKFRFHKGSLFGIFLIGAGIFVLFTSMPYNGSLFIMVFNNSYVRMVAVAGVFVGILILTIKTAIWGSKYIKP